MVVTVGTVGTVLAVLRGKTVVSIVESLLVGLGTLLCCTFVGDAAGEVEAMGDSFGAAGWGVGFPDPV